jgi:hypothetical protein
LWDKQKEIAESIVDNRITAVRSCHDSGKSFIAARIALWYLETNKDSKVITTAPSWNQVREILWNEIHSAYNSVKKVDERFVFSGKLLDTRFGKSEDWFAIGMATRKEGDSAQVADRLLGFHSKTGKILVIVDEASGILEPVWGAIEGLLTSDNARLLAIGNPYRINGTFAKFFKQNSVKKIHIQDTDIPNIYEDKVIYAGLMSPSYPKEIAEKYGKESNVYRVKVKGDFPTSESDTLIPLSDIEDAFLRESVIAEGDKKLGVDVARFGDNRTTLVVRQGKKVLSKECYWKEDTMQTVGRIINKIISENINHEDVSVDDIGVGGGVVDRLKEKGYNVNGVNVGTKAEVEGKEEGFVEDEKLKEKRFFDTRASSYWAVKDWIKTASIPKDDDFLELADIKYKFSSSGIKIESKDEMKKRGLLSPDVADALMLTFCPYTGSGYGHLEFL